MTISIEPVASASELTTFIKLPWRVYSTAENWVPPLISERRRHLDRAQNPFFAHAEAEYFLARRDGEPVGRISAHVDFNFQRFQDNRWGHFGFFECVDDGEVARALIDVACEWLRARGCDHVMGPLSFTTNDENGVMVEGFDDKPIVLAAWNHPYYDALLQSTGLTKAMDEFMWYLDISERSGVHPAIWEMSAKVSSEHGITVRPMSKQHLERDVEAFIDVYNSAWQRNWGFVPLTEAEVRHYAKEIGPLLDENWAWVAERDGETLGAALSVPDFNQVLEHLDGRLLPFGWAKALWYRRRIDRVRVFALGVKPEYQHTGIAARFYELHFDAGASTQQHSGELGWVLESNKAMNRGMEGMGAEIVRRYRLYERAL